MRAEEKGFNIFQKAYRAVKDFFYGIKVKASGVLNRKKSDKPFNAKKARSRRQRNKMIFIWGGLAIPIINFIVFYIYANSSAIAMAFRTDTISGSVYNFDNFRMAWRNLTSDGNHVRESLVNTLIYFGFNFLFMTPLTYMVSYFLFKKIWGYKIFRYVFFMPSIISSVIMSTFFKYMLAPGGPVMEELTKLFGRTIVLLGDSKTALGTMLFYNFWCGFGVNMLYYTANFQRIPQEVLESARIEGVTVWQEVRYILFPLTWPFFSTMLFLQLTSIFGANGAPLLLTGGDFGTWDFGFWMFKTVTDGGDKGQYVGAALGWMMTLVALPISLFFKYLADRVEPVEY